MPVARSLGLRAPAGPELDVLLDVAQPLPQATHVLATSATGYTTNLLQVWLVGLELCRWWRRHVVHIGRTDLVRLAASA